MKYIYFFSLIILFGCSDVQKQMDKASETSRKSDSLLKEFKKVDESLIKVKKEIDESLPTKAQEDSLLRVPRKMKAKLDSLVK